MFQMEAEKAKFFTNVRGNQQLIDSENYVYYSNKKTDTGRSYWICTEKSCSGRANVDKDGNVTRVSNHNHGSNIAGLHAHLQAVGAIQKSKENPNILPRQILGNLANQPTSLETVLSKRPEASLTR